MVLAGFSFCSTSRCSRSLCMAWGTNSEEEKGISLMLCHLLPHILIYLFKNCRGALEFRSILSTPGAGQMVKIIVNGSSLFFLDPERILEDSKHNGIDTGILSPGLFLQCTGDGVIYAT